MKNCKSKVSVVVPVYNMQDYLNTCIKAIVHQTYTDLEIILVNDGSNDESDTICLTWASKDKRIKYIASENGGVSNARNLGIKNATGEYVVFIDADDIVARNYIETLLACVHIEQADMVLTNCISFCECQIPKFVMSEEKKIFDSEFPTLLFTITNGLIGGKLFKLQLINEHGLLFNRDYAVSEDLIFCLEYLKYANKVVFNSSLLYGYLQRNSSAAHNTHTVKWFDCLKVYNELVRSYIDDPCYNYIVYYYLKNLYEARYVLRKTPSLFDQRIVKQEISRMERFSKLLPTAMKLRLIVCKYFFWTIIVKRKV